MRIKAFKPIKLFSLQLKISENKQPPHQLQNKQATEEKKSIKWYETLIKYSQQAVGDMKKKTPWVRVLKLRIEM